VWQSKRAEFAFSDADVHELPLRVTENFVAQNKHWTATSLLMTTERIEIRPPNLTS
jgi:hypothetical protein